MEFWYYLLFPATLLQLSTRTWKGLFRWNTILLAGLLLLLPLHYYAYFVIWLMGMAAAAFRIRFRRALPCAAVLVLALANSRFGTGPMYLRELFIGAACALLICAVKNGAGFPARFAGAHQRLSGFSYSLYVVHFPVLTLCTAIIYAFLGLPTQSGGLLRNFGIFLFISTTCAGVSYAMSRVTEAKTPQIRRALLHWLPERPKP
jgi:hypothetical protein